MSSVGVISSAAAAVMASPQFRKYLNKLIEKQRKPKPREVAIQTLDDLAEKQAEGMAYEQIYLSLLSGRLSAEQATKIIEGLGEKVNPHPLQWLQNKLMDIRGWIISAVKFLREIGNALGLKVDKVEVELSLTPHVTFTFQSSSASVQ